MSKLLDDVTSPEDIKKLSYSQLDQLAEEIREFLIEMVSRTGGHLASNLGIVELTLALHKVFHTPEDKIIWDVGHQSYVHKILTGRREAFENLRQMDGISGFPKTCESEFDCFNTGHSSTSISAALGMARARDIQKQNYAVAAVIGDGAMTGGMAFEALNDAGRSPNNLIVILNDNEMSISRNVGGLSTYLSKLRTKPFYFKVKKDLNAFLDKIPAVGKPAIRVLDRAKGTIKYMVMPGIIFEELGFKYLGPIDGHNIQELVSVLSRARNIKGPVFIHVCTQKGKGYRYAEQKPQVFHGVSPFEVETGEVKAGGGPGYSDILGRELVRLGERDPRIVAITAAMRHSTGLDPFAKAFRDRFFDVGIAEQHAVTMAAGLARGGMIPLVAVYSSFLQRAYDQILHDVAAQNLHVVLGVDRAGIVGEDGETHQGLYDLSYLGSIPNMTVMAPCDYRELADMLEYAVCVHQGPVAIRYPRGSGSEQLFDPQPLRPGRGIRVRYGTQLTLAVVGSMMETALKVADELVKMSISVDVINARFIKPLDEKLLVESVEKTGCLVTLEDNTVAGGFGSAVLKLLNEREIGARTLVLGFPDCFVPQGSRSQLFKRYGLDVQSIVDRILKIWRQ